MFTVTKEWLFSNYGSRDLEQKQQTKAWLLKYGKDVSSDKLEEWSNWKHLSEYQVNTNDIVDRCLAMIGKEYMSELEVHKLVNLMRVPLGIAYDRVIREYKPRNILELGVGGDSAISTSIFLRWIEEKDINNQDPYNRPQLISVDRNPLGMTWVRYNKYPFWKFIQNDSLVILTEFLDHDKWWDLIFIDTIHSYTHTMKELDLASRMTNWMLMDDATFTGNDFDPEPGGVKRAIEEWSKSHQDWVVMDCVRYDSVKLIRRVSEL